MDPLPPLLYELGNSLIWSLVVPAAAILMRFFVIEFRRGGRAALMRRGQIGIAIFAIIGGDGLTREWTWMGRYCENSQLDCRWMLAWLWGFAPAIGFSIEIMGLLCLIRVLSPESWGPRAWLVSACASLMWSVAWFSPLAAFWRDHKLLGALLIAGALTGMAWIVLRRPRQA